MNSLSSVVGLRGSRNLHRLWRPGKMLEKSAERRPRPHWPPRPAWVSPESPIDAWSGPAGTTPQCRSSVPPGEYNFPCKLRPPLSLYTNSRDANMLTTFLYWANRIYYIRTTMIYTSGARARITTIQRHGDQVIATGKFPGNAAPYILINESTCTSQDLDWYRCW